MKFFILMLTVFAAVLATNAFAAQEPSIDRLLNKLPPPEKFVDPAINDPLAKQMAAAAKANNFGGALEASRKLASRYPKSLPAQGIHGMLALLMGRYPEAEAAYRKTLALQPDLPVAYTGLALAEAGQEHYRAAFGDFQRVTRLAPKADIGWIGLSASAEKLGRRQESLDFARRATAVAPSSAGAWNQLARAEGLAGNKSASAKALARAKQLQPGAPRRMKKKVRIRN
jgi:tetratricopeptide (TPR) repeat protein